MTTEIKAYKNTENTRFALLEYSINSINNTMNNIEKRFDRIDSRLDRIENKMDDGFKNINNRIDDGFKNLNNRMWTNFLWMLGLYASTIGIVLSSVYYMINS